MKHVTCKEIEPLLPATAAGALDSEEEQTVTAHLALCTPCTMHLHKFQAAVEQLAYGVPQVDPPGALRVKVLQSIVTATQAPPRPPALRLHGGRASSPPKRRSPGGFGVLYQRFAPAALAACVVLLLGSGVWMGVMAQQVDMANQKLDGQQSLHNLLVQPDAQMTPLKAMPRAGAASGSVVLAPGQSKVAVMLTHLPLPPVGRIYQLWMLDHGNSQPVPAAPLNIDGTGVVWQVVNVPADPYKMAGMRITDEPPAGSDSPTGQTWMEGWYR